MTPEFRPWPKIARLNRDIIVTEKVDGTNAAIGVTDEGEVYAQSRTRIVTPENDNFGFAAWVASKADQLREALGTGLHFGEWFGKGIQRGYGMSDRQFRLFNVKRFEPVPFGELGLPEVGIVPILYRGVFSEQAIKECLNLLREHGSHVAPFAVPEGVVVFHTASGTMYKVTLENDEQPKGQVSAEAAA